ncbi:DUF433 domain-containing protein [Synechococcus sp. PCC 7335]|uniref:DUF433 domain-containing protein n=1 Tax=Synechococcus sp. (strain ATCC 29403 / PCC 7335) TaxID=91464 RepID=UPI0002E4DD41
MCDRAPPTGLKETSRFQHEAFVMDSTLLERITIDPEVCHGKPCIRGLRYPVEFILELLSAGMSHAEILSGYDDLEEDDILSALLYAARLYRA